MTPTARARIEQTVERKGWMSLLDGSEAVKLILAERARLKRGVNEKRKITVSMCSTSEFCKGYREACNDILALWET